MATGRLQTVAETKAFAEERERFVSDDAEGLVAGDDSGDLGDIFTGGRFTNLFAEFVLRTNMISAELNKGVDQHHDS